MEFALRPLHEWEEGVHAKPNAGSNTLTFDRSHNVVEVWLIAGEGIVRMSIRPDVEASASSPALTVNAPYIIKSAEGIKRISFYAGSNLSGENVQYRAK